MPNLKKLSFCLIVSFLLSLSFNASAADTDGCLDCPTIPEDIPNYFLWWEILPITIDPDSQELVAVSGRLPPFSWSVSGTGFSLNPSDGATNTLFADPDACGTAEITVTDSGGNSIVGEVRCSNGVWGDQIDGCILPGEGGGSWTVTGYQIKGKYKQTQHRANLSGAYYHWGECPLEVCDDQCATRPECDPDYGCDPCLALYGGAPPCSNAGYAVVYKCPPHCRAWCVCNTALYYQEWTCPQ